MSGPRIGDYIVTFIDFSFFGLRFVEYQFVQDLYPPNTSYEQTNIFLYACAASVIGAIIFSKGKPYRQPLYSNGNNSQG